MKAAFYFLVGLCFFIAVDAIAGVTVKTTRGQVYEDAVIKGVEANSLVLIHQGETIRISLKQLSREARGNLKIRPTADMSKWDFDSQIKSFKNELFELDVNYANHLGKLAKDSQSQGDLDYVLAVKKELAEFQAGKKPQKTEYTKLEKLREIYHAQRVKHRNAIVDKLKVALDRYQADLKVVQKSLTISGNLEEAIDAKKEEGRIAALLADRKQALFTLGIFAPSGSIKPRSFVKKTDTLIDNASMSPSASSKEKPFVNHLGMRFVPVPITGGPTDGKGILFSVWETRVGDYKAFIKKNSERAWPDAGFTQSDDHPAVKVTNADAAAFCEWLTEEGRKSGSLGKDGIYRLPTDHEWSCAAGIGKKENADVLIIDKHNKLVGVFPWGSGFNASDMSGNYYGEETNNSLKKPTLIRGYNDGFPNTSPVASFIANEFGLYDIGGNVQEECSTLKGNTQGHVTRGGGWADYTENRLSSSARSGIPLDARNSAVGFRVILVPGKQSESSQATGSKSSGALHVWGKQNVKGKIIPLNDLSDKEVQNIERVEFEGFRGYWHAFTDSGELITSGWPENAERPKGAIRDVVDLAGGNTIGSAVRENGKLVFWGYGIESKAGNLMELNDVASVETGNGFTFAMKKDGEVAYHAQKTTAAALTAPGADFLTNVRFISCGLGIAFVQKKDNTAYIWTGKSPGDKIQFPKGKKVIDAEFSGRKGLILLEDGTVVPYGNLTHPMPEKFTKIKAVRVADRVYMVQKEDDSWVAWGEEIDGVIEKINSIGKAKDLALLVMRNQGLVSLAWVD